MLMNKKRALVICIAVLITTLGVLLNFHRLSFADESPFIAPVYRKYKLPLPTVVKGISIPKEVLACQSLGTGDIDLLGVTQVKHKTFYLLGKYVSYNYQNPLNSSDELIQFSPTAYCLRLQEGNDKPLSHFIPLVAARNLELQRYKHMIKRLGSKQKLEQELARRINNSSQLFLLSPEQIWALENLQIKLPPNYRILRPDTFPS